MITSNHGLSVGIERVNGELFVKLSVVGKLTHEDYEVFTPMLDSAIKEVPNTEVNVVVDLTHFEGWELRAAWDDFKLGLKHGRNFSKIAMIGSKTWQEAAAKVGSWFISGEMKTFATEAEAMAWISNNS
ncbi:hypothetical protein A1OW_15355 [Enterovibrio norvegicus]|uniref:STAS/SEC14 domain-containing protein n=1 Tax=Enterovibrio norvegicus TaxID=188144 RepID=UPI000318160A|nr:STAS/SEC14 domain-containing protein [Enterovibrio norvegicus]OEE50003.1 hypothetical protein A1OS_06690 [Enterovibrio norvegicus]OEF48509.1 hypothetical protein A1OW_15355 [Enterovibrio norvegicus]PMH66064.1 hypothetical protein BCU62_10640 [Enterovibrio norvegicus]